MILDKSELKVLAAVNDGKYAFKNGLKPLILALFRGDVKLHKVPEGFELNIEQIGEFGRRRDFRKTDTLFDLTTRQRKHSLP